MAFAQQTTLIRLRFRDNDGSESTCQVNFAPSVGVDTVLSLVAPFRTLIQGLSTAKCIEADAVWRWNDTAHYAISDTSNTRRSGAFSFETSATTLYFFRIPSINPSFIMESGDYANIAIDITNSTVMDFINAMTGGISGVAPCNQFLNDLTGISTAFVEQY